MKLDSSLCESASTMWKQKVERFIPAVYTFDSLFTCPEGGVVES